MKHYWIVVACWLPVANLAPGQDVVRYRTRSNKSEWTTQEVKGTVEAESVAGIKLGGNAIAAADIIDIEYEAPPGIRIDLREARQAEEAQKNDEALRRYRSLAASPAAASAPALKRALEYKAACLAAQKSDVNAAEHRAAVAALTAWIRDHPDSWRRYAATRQLARLQLDAEPANFDAARKALEDLAQMQGISPEVKSACQLAIVGLWLDQGKPAQAKQALDAVAPTDARVPAYRIACADHAATPGTAAAQLEKLLLQADDGIKPTIYNLLGDCHRRDAKKTKEALFAYLWVDVVYNADPMETAKAQDRISELFKRTGQDERAKAFRDKARGRGVYGP